MYVNIVIVRYMNVTCQKKLYECKFISLFLIRKWVDDFYLWKCFCHEKYEKAENEVYDCERRVE
jgi:hypothetical protein